jgi:hypothetical protein
MIEPPLSSRYGKESRQELVDNLNSFFLSIQP